MTGQDFGLHSTKKCSIAYVRTGESLMKFEKE
jgi:hypothetical protein